MKIMFYQRVFLMQRREEIDQLMFTSRVKTHAQLFEMKAFCQFDNFCILKHLYSEAI